MWAHFILKAHEKEEPKHLEERRFTEKNMVVTGANAADAKKHPRIHHLAHFLFSKVFYRTAFILKEWERINTSMIT